MYVYTYVCIHTHTHTHTQALLVRAKEAELTAAAAQELACVRELANKAQAECLVAPSQESLHRASIAPD